MLYLDSAGDSTGWTGVLLCLSSVEKRLVARTTVARRKGNVCVPFMLPRGAVWMFYGDAVRRAAGGDAARMPLD